MKFNFEIELETLTFEIDKTGRRTEPWSENIRYQLNHHGETTTMTSLVGIIHRKIVREVVASWLAQLCLIFSISVNFLPFGCCFWMMLYWDVNHRLRRVWMFWFLRPMVGGRIWSKFWSTDCTTCAFCKQKNKKDDFGSWVVGDGMLVVETEVLGPWSLLIGREVAEYGWQREQSQLGLGFEFSIWGFCEI